MFFEDVKGMTHKSQLNQKASQKLKSIVLQLVISAKDKNIGELI